MLTYGFSSLSMVVVLFVLLHYYIIKFGNPGKSSTFLKFVSKTLTLILSFLTSNPP